MERLNASDAKREFGDMLLKVQQSPVGINKNGKPVAVMISAVEYEQIELMKERFLKVAIQEGLTDLEAGNVVPGSKAFEELRKQL